MANEIAFDYQPTGATTLYAILRLQKQMVNASTGALQAISSANWTSSVITLSDTGNVGHYFASVPGSTPAGDYSYSIASNASPVIGDTTIGIGNVSWTGTAESFPLASSSATATSVGVTAGAVSATVSGGSGMTLVSTGPTTVAVTTTPANGSDIVLSNNSGTMNLSLTAPSNGTLSWQILVRPVSGGTGSLALDGASAAIYSRTQPAVYPIPAGTTVNYFIRDKGGGAVLPTGYAYYLSLTNSNASSANASYSLTT